MRRFLRWLDEDVIISRYAVFCGLFLAISVLWRWFFG